MESIISLVSSGRLVRKRIWLGGCSGITAGGPPTLGTEVAASADESGAGAWAAAAAATAAALQYKLFHMFSFKMLQFLNAIRTVMLTTCT